MNLDQDEVSVVGSTDADSMSNCPGSGSQSLTSEDEEGYEYDGKQISCTKVHRECGHACLESPFDKNRPCPSCRQYVEFILPCGHKIFGYCGIGVPSRNKCQGICGKKRRCGHPCVQACGEHLTCDQEVFNECDYCIVFREAKDGKRRMPQFFLDLDNGIKDDDPLGPVFKERCLGYTPEQVADYRRTLATQGIFKASDHPGWFSGAAAAFL